jgi:ABC-2 type transport system permease protein
MTALDLARWEWFKLRGRRVIWILLAGLVVFSSLVVLLRFGDYQFQKDRAIADEVLFNPGMPLPPEEVKVDCEAFLAGARPAEFPPGFTVDDIDVELTSRECEKEIAEITARLDRHITEFTLPGTIPWAMRWTQLVSVPVLAFLTVLVLGSEYTWGTLRTMLMRGPGRARVLAVKLLFVAAALAVTWVAVLGAIVATSAIVTAFASDVNHGSWAGGVFGEVVGDTLSAWYAGLPYVALAALLAVLFSRWASGTLAASGFAIGIFFLELFTMGRLISLFDGVSGMAWFGTVAEFDLGWNTAAWMFGQGGEPIRGFALAGAIGTADYPGDLHALLVLTAYLAIFTVLTFVLFRRRDVAGPTG